MSPLLVPCLLMTPSPGAGGGLSPVPILCLWLPFSPGTDEGRVTCISDSLWLLPPPGADEAVASICPMSSFDFLPHLGQTGAMSSIPVSCLPMTLTWDRHAMCHLYLSHVSLKFTPSPGVDRGHVTCTCDSSGFLPHLGQMGLCHFYLSCVSPDFLSHLGQRLCHLYLFLL